MIVEQIKKRIQKAETSFVIEVLDMGSEKVDVLITDAHPIRNVEKALKELGIEKYCISGDSITYSIYIKRNFQDLKKLLKNDKNMKRRINK